MSGTEFIQYLKKIDFLLNDLLYKSQLAHTFLPTEEIVSQSVSIKILTEAFYEQNLVPLFDQFYKKLKQHEKGKKTDLTLRIKLRRPSFPL